MTQINFTQLRSDRSKSIINPREIFLALPNKSAKYNGYLRDVQSEVLENWFIERDSTDVIVKMNTGSGKTIAGLLMLKSCMNEKLGIAIYIAPDNYLVSQVEKEAIDLGIQVTLDENSFDFTSGKSILITNIYKVFNGKSRFGISRGRVISPDYVVFDDVHACVEVAKVNCSLVIRRTDNEDLYMKILNLYKNEMERQNADNLRDIISNSRYTYPIMIPFWEVKKR